jgi:hypothetical protein
MEKILNGNQLSVVFGVSPIFGFVDGTSLLITTPPNYNYDRDLYGNITRSRINDNSAEIILTLTKASSANALLSNFVELDRQSDAGTFPIFIKDVHGNNIFTSKSASIMSSNEHWQDKHRKWIIIATNNIYN